MELSGIANVIPKISGEGTCDKKGSRLILENGGDV